MRLVPDPVPVEGAGSGAPSEIPSARGPRRAEAPAHRVRMSAVERRAQLLEVGRSLFAERGFDATSVEEIAAVAGVSKPVVYEHFGGKEGLYAVVVDHEVSDLLTRIHTALSVGPEAGSRELVERAAFALLGYIEECTEGFRILVRDSPSGAPAGTFASLISDATRQVEHIMVTKFAERGFNAEVTPMYAQMLVGMVALTGQWWLDARHPAKEVVAAHLVNLAWNGLSGLESAPGITGSGAGEDSAGA